MFSQFLNFGVRNAYRCNICLSASIASWVMAHDSEFNVPTFEEVEDNLSNHDSSRTDMNQLNHKYFADAYDALIETFDSRFSNTKRREVLNYIPQIIDSIGGRGWLTNKCVVEIGPGTGVFIAPLSAAVAPNGCYIGLDISPAFIYYLHHHIRSTLTNVKFHLNTPKSLSLPPKLKKEVDVFLLAASYHHLDDAGGTLTQIYEYLKPGGKLVIIEFRKPEPSWYEQYGDNPKYNGVNDVDTYSNDTPMFEWMKGHMRFTESEAKQEIISAGFVYEGNIMEQQWKHHFIHIYRKPSFF